MKYETFHKVSNETCIHGNKMLCPVCTAIHGGPRVPSNTAIPKFVSAPEDDETPTVPVEKQNTSV